MKTTEVPFNKYLDIRSAGENSGFFLYLNAKGMHLNHLGTIHASVLFSLAEASSGEYLLKAFEPVSKDVIPVVRKAEVRFRKPVQGKISAKAGLISTTKEEVLNELKTRGRTLCKVGADIYSENGTKVFSSVFEWFIVTALKT
jgi:acyl-coenzyme A thioesterase PaaI-like protein